MGFGFFKMDVGIGMLRGVEEALVAPPGMLSAPMIGCGARAAGWRRGADSGAPLLSFSFAIPG